MLKPGFYPPGNGLDMNSMLACNVTRRETGMDIQQGGGPPSDTADMMIPGYFTELSHILIIESEVHAYLVHADARSKTCWQAYSGTNRLANNETSCAYRDNE